MITEINADNSFFLEFNEFNGSGWANTIEGIITTQIKPEKFEKREIEVSFYYSEYEYDIEKDNIKFLLHLDDEGSRYLKLQSEITEESKLKLREWATIIAKKVAESIK